MEKLSANTERKGAPMSDVALARKLVAEIGGDCWDGKADLIDRVYDAICRHFRDLDQPHSWTRRRVRSFWHREAAGVRYHEMVELAAVAHAQKLERKRIEEAKRDHAEFVTRTARLATALAVQDEEFHREAIEAFGRIAGSQDDIAVERTAQRRHEALAGCDRASGTLGAGGCL
ncbi:hypothetical protein [Chelativorans sp.]|uniref:hypothetical protein n=1 Tax=Chelativorans sp. TaxID=2203393 RepID=UPI002812519E|nr:hypothetical protein [Chelativorans sp.]